MAGKDPQLTAAHGATPELQAKLQALLFPAIEAAGFEPIRLRTVPGPRGLIVQLEIDRWPGKGIIALEDCALVSRRLSALLDEADPVPGEFDLEVSSPGMNRVLRHEGDLQRFSGMTAKITIGEGASKESVTGAIQWCDHGVLVLRVGKNALREIAVTDIVKARLDPTIEEWQQLGKKLAQESAEAGIPAAADGEETQETE